VLIEVVTLALPIGSHFSCIGRPGAVLQSESAKRRREALKNLNRLLFFLAGAAARASARGCCAALRKTPAQGMTEVGLAVHKENPVLRLYQRAGYEIFGEDGEHAWKMTKPLR
jgi:hypothetical protein